MSDLIDRQALCDDLREYKLCPVPISSDESEVKGYNDGIDLAISVIAEFPSAEPVKHGKWIDIDEQTYTWKVRCSCCGYERSMMSTQGKYPNYCEECGSRMDAE